MRPPVSAVPPRSVSRRISTRSISRQPNDRARSRWSRTASCTMDLRPGPVKQLREGRVVGIDTRSGSRPFVAASVPGRGCVRARSAGRCCAQRRRRTPGNRRSGPSPPDRAHRRPLKHSRKTSCTASSTEIRCVRRLPPALVEVGFERRSVKLDKPHTVPRCDPFAAPSMMVQLVSRVSGLLGHGLLGVAWRPSDHSDGWEWGEPGRRHLEG